MAYGSDGLRRGGRIAEGAAESARGAERDLSAVDVGAAALGTVRGAAELAAAIGRARDGHGATCRQVADGHTDLDRRAQDTAGMGDQLDVDAAAIAAAAVPR
jgi:hypothetical protein